MAADGEAGGALPAFLGTHQPRMDDKGRLFLPAKFREPLAGGLVITRGHERCLYVFPNAEFARMSAGLQDGPVGNKDTRHNQRMLMSGASAEVPDKQGRVTVPPHLRSYAGLSKDCVVIGAGTRVEVWDAASWSRYLQEQESAFADRDEEVATPGVR